MPHPFFDVDRPIVIGHRGAAGIRPENTLLSFETALAEGAQIIESDIHVSRDGVPILLHDPSIERVTNASGLAVDLDWSRLRCLDAGYHFLDEEGQAPFRDAALRIPSLEEAFARFPEARFNLEIKCDDEQVIAATLDLIARFDRADRTLLAAGEDPIMKRLRAALTRHSVQPAVGASLGEIVAVIQSALDAEKPMPTGVDALQIPPSFAGQPIPTPRFIEQAHAHDIQVHVWTVNDLDEIACLLDVGVDGIVTDHPGRVAAWLNRHV